MSVKDETSNKMLCKSEAKITVRRKEYLAKGEGSNTKKRTEEAAATGS